MKDIIEFKTIIPAHTYKAYWKEDDKYDLYYNSILITVGIKESDLYTIIELLNGVIVNN